MNVLERTILHRWRSEAYDCWSAAEGDAELAEQLFRARKPPHIQEVPWSLIIALVIELFKRWKTKSPQAVIDDDEAKYLGLETD